MTFGAPAPLDAAVIIDLAERAAQLSPAGWSLALLQRVYPEASAEAVTGLPLGARDRLILAVRRSLKTAPLLSEPVCMACGATYEVTLDPVALGLAGEAPWPDPSPRIVEIAGQSVQVRPVVLGDILAIERMADAEAAAQALAERVSGDEVPIGALSEALEAMDPAADIWIATTCPECGVAQSLAFDPVHFVAHDMRMAAQSLLRDVVEIARAFHWSEAEILALPDQRRAYYLAEARA